MKRFRISRKLLIGSSTCLSAVVLALPAAAPGEPIVHYPRESVVVQNHLNAIAILFPEKVGLWLDKKGPMVRGIRRITVGQHEILGPVPGGTPAPRATLVTGGGVRPARHWTAYLRRLAARLSRLPKLPRSTYPWPPRGGLEIEYGLSLAGRYLGWRQNGRFTCVRVGLPRGVMEWLIAPTMARVGGTVYRGLEWKLRLRRAGKIISIHLEQPFAIQAGDWHFTQQDGQFSEAHLGTAGRFQLRSRYTLRNCFSGRQPFFFAAGPQGATISYFGAVVPALESERQEGSRLIIKFVRVAQLPVEAGETPSVRWLFSRGDFSSKWTALNEWTRACDFVGHYYRRMVGARRVDPLPTMQVSFPGFDGSLPRARGPAPSPRASVFGRIAGTLPRMAKLGIKMVWIHAMESAVDVPPRDIILPQWPPRSVDQMWRVTVSPREGGEAGLKYLCGAAHRLGIKVETWIACGHLDASSPLFRDHADWVAWNSDGTPVTYGYTSLVGASFSRGYSSYFIRHLREIHAATGLDGVFLDSYTTFGNLTDFSAGHPFPRLGEVARLIGKIQRVGMAYVWVEGSGPFGLPSFGYNSGDSSTFVRLVKGKEYGLYYTSADTAMEPHSYYRTVASKGAIFFQSLAAFDRLPAASRRFIVAANHAYMAVLPYMKQRRLIGRGKKWLGVEWSDAGKPRVLFTFTSLPWQVSAGATVRDVTDGTDHLVPTGTFHARAWRTYLVVKR